MGRWRTLFATTGLTLTVSTTAFLVLSLVAIGFYILVPVSRQAADDLAALIELSAKTWVELPPETRPDFERELFDHHGLKVSVANHDRREKVSNNPALYLRFLEKSLYDRLGQPLVVMAMRDEPQWLHVNIEFPGRVLEMSFQAERLGTRFFAAVVLIAAGGAVVILLTSILLVRRVTRPLTRLSEATSRVAGGASSEPLDESGPTELASLARRFNQMQRQVRELLESRTTLLAGISHDLRTPIARMRVALEMLPADSDPTLLEQLEKDLVEMDHLIRQALELARGLGNAPSVPVDLVELLRDLVRRYREQGVSVEFAAPGALKTEVAAVPLRRVVTNLVDNALRFSGNEPVGIALDLEPHRAVIRVTDRGPGIPEDQLDAVFRPFHRLETSRSRATGGSGLGLAIVRQLCDANGWGVSLHRRPRGGTEARLAIPV